eukprot:TRINITY_DN1120_c0_g2_i1.p1 TRINITY_DN1120_c0_g2~~TRINITY_DN1120_c0_g2_i1.p1  ORF type:complete len:211 (+),score=50.56 TRINITY_DN1120_c0_g2_i1:46-678(+)
MMSVRSATLARQFRTFAMTPLPYDFTALKPTMSEETVSLHYNKHHTGYCTKLTDWAKANDTSMLDKSIAQILEENKATPETFIFRMAAQIANHDFFWASMSPSGGGAPTGAIADKINEQWGSFEDFKNDFNGQVGGHFGSGWVWLVQDASGKLSIVQTHDANIVADGLSPILVCDAWEHAFYVDYRNDKAAYVKSWWNIVNWEFANKNLQ